jgi:hypothetical protein
LDPKPLLTVYCENDGELNETLLDIRFCALNNTSVITHEVRSVGQHIVRREKTGKVTMTCHLSNIEPRNGGRTHIARGQDDITNARFLYKGILKPSS